MVKFLIYLLFLAINSSIYSSGMLSLAIIDTNNGGKDRRVFNLSEKDPFSCNEFASLLTDSEYKFLTIARVYCDFNQGNNFYDYEKEGLFAWFFVQMKNGNALTDLQAGSSIAYIEIHEISVERKETFLVKDYYFPRDQDCFQADLFYNKDASILDLAMHSWAKEVPLLIPVYFRTTKFASSFLYAIWEFTDAYVQMRIDEAP